MVTSRAVIFQGQGRDFTMAEFEVPSPAPGTILLKMELCGICGTDVHIYQEGNPRPLVFGHENVGIIEALGAGVSTDFLGRPIKVGDRLVFQPGGTGLPPAYGLTDLADSPSKLSGGQADYIYLDKPGTAYFKTDLAPEVAVMFEPLTIGLHATDRSRIRIGDTVVIQGSGAIGLMSLIAAKHAGATKTIMVGGPAGRLEVAKQLGADVVIDLFDVSDPAERLRMVLDETTRREGADVVIECAGVRSAIIEGIEMTRYSGTFCELGHFIDVGDMTINPNKHFLKKDLTLVAPYGSRRDHFVRCLPLMEKEPHLFEGLVSHRLPLSRVKEGFEALSGRYLLDGRAAIKIAIEPALRA